MGGKAKGIRKTGLVRKGTPLPGSPSYRFESAHLTAKEADKAEYGLLEKNDTEATKRLRIPRQILLFRKKIRITPKTPRLK